MITVEVWFDDDDIKLCAKFTVDSLASQIGCESRNANAYFGQYVLELQQCYETASNKNHEPTSYQLEKLMDEAMKQIKCSQ